MLGVRPALPQQSARGLGPALTNMAPLPCKAGQAGAGVGGVPRDAVLDTLSPVQAGPQHQADRGYGDRRCPPVSPCPSRAYLPPSSHTSAEVRPCAPPAPRGVQGAHRGCLPHSRAGPAPQGLPWDRRAVLFLLGEGERLHGVSPAGQGDMDVPLLITRDRGKGGQESPCTANPPVTQDTRRSQVGKHGRREQG